MAERHAMRQRDLPLEADGAAASAPPARRGPNLLLLFFACAAMFVLGVLVGRGTAPVRFDMERLQAELTALRGALDQRGGTPPAPPKPTSAGREKAPEHTELDFYEALKDPKDAARLNRELARVADLPARPAEQPAVAPAEEKPAVKAALQPAAAASRPPPAAANGALAAPPATAAATTPSSATGYQLQAASLASAADADSLVKRLQARGLPAYRQQVTVPDKGVRYRVRIGGFRSRSEAEAELMRLKGERINALLLTGEG
jgi:cell division septation protein DedD